jgi:K+-sensing histidine kinase KdpD
LSHRIDAEGLEIFADPMLENVFFTLANNVIRHGGSATEIYLHYHETPEGLTLFFEDNGTGVPDTMKEKIFTRRFRQQTGMGLFLTQEILSITDIIIKETGTYGKGARFEIRVRNGGYRFTDNHQDSGK